MPPPLLTGTGTLAGSVEADTATSTARAVALACSGVIAMVASFVLVGWAIRNVTMTSIVPGYIAMNPATSLAFMACAVAIAVRRSAARGAVRRLSVTLGGLVAVTGIVRLAGYAFGWDVLVDSVLFSSRLDLGTGMPNRMAPNTAFNFVLVGTAITCLERPRLAQLLALGSALTAFIALIGYAYSVTSLVQVASFIPMALHTAVMFVVLAAAVLGATPQHGLTAAIASRGGGGRVLRRMAPPLLLAPPLLGWLRLQGELAGFYGPAFGVAAIAAVMVVLGFLLTWWTASVVDRGEADRRRAEDMTFRMAHFDSLTSLPNRMLFEDRMQQAVARAEREGGMLAVLFIDLDGFKHVNDTAGHDAGDQVLKATACRIQASIRSVDTAARLGGDEFTVILERISDLNDVVRISDRMLARLGAEFPESGTQATLSASVGISVFPQDGRTPAQLLARADAAMYRAKRAGKNRVVFHSP